ncbi:MAG: T9SS type A sorting domain-containing protein [Taibaiella sp.]|nr:T9SS type A sorting domain-containing protein [Taibaiella sp.]
MNRTTITGKLHYGAALVLFTVISICARAQQSTALAGSPSARSWSPIVGVEDGALVKGRTASENQSPVAHGKERTNFTSFSTWHRNSNSEVQKYNRGNENHPELGLLYPDAPCSDCYEIIEKRTETEKYFVKEGTEARQFAVQGCLYPLHYKDENGRWMTINSHLQKGPNDGTFVTIGRPVEVTIDTRNKRSTLTGKQGAITYNNDLELIFVAPGGVETSLGKANWSHFTAGDDGVRVSDAWPGIDIEMAVLVNSLKTNFIVKSALPAYAAGRLVIRDHISLPNNLSLNADKGQTIKDALTITNAEGQIAYTMHKAVAYEQATGPDAVTELAYKKSGGNVLDIEVPGSLLSRPASSYPLVVDPLVSGTLSSGFTYTSGSFPPALTSTSEYCTNTNNISIPAAATLTDIQVTFNYYGPPSVSWAQSRLAFQVGGGCTYGWLSCSAAAFSSGIPGNTCGLLNSSFWGGTPAWGSTSGCLPAYSCTSYTLPFQLLLTQAQTSTAACAQTVYATASGFTVTVFGTTAMLPSITPSTSTVMCMPDTLILAGSPVTGTWSSSVPAVGTVSTTGVVTGLTNGTTNITYTASGCTSAITVTVGTTPTVSGTPAICFPGSATLTGSPTGGTWTSSATSIATITSGGLVTGVSIGTTIINYNTGTCSRNVPFDVNNPAAVTPTTQPTGLSVTATTHNGGTITFTPNSSTGYLVIASTSPTLSATPATYSTYATGSTFGGGIVIQGSTSGSAPAYTTTLLNSNTHYYLFVFAFNNNCSGPQYNTTAPLTGTMNTCIAPTSVPTIVSSGVNVINLSWTASPTGGGYISPINYTVYAYSDAACTSLVPGYPVPAGTGTTYAAGGLATGTQYWFRIAPADACAILSPINSGLTSCSAAGSLPYLQTFEVNTTLGDRSPNCMTSNVQNCVFSGVQTSVTYIGTINTNHTAGGTKFYNFFRGGACSAGWANQWLLLPGLALTAGSTYTLSFWYRTDGAAWSSLTSQYSTVSTVPAVTSTTMGGTPGTIGSGVSGFSNTTYTQYIQTFTVPASGTYYIGLDAQSGGSAGLLAIDDIEVCEMPALTVSAGPTPFCDPDTVLISTTGTTGAVHYSWSGPSGFTSTVTTLPPFTSLGPGTYTYTLTGTNDPISAGYGGYCTASVTTTFTINTPPDTIAGLTEVCTGANITLTNATAGGSWSSSTTAVGTVSSTGVVTGIAAGTTTITYDIGGCYVTKVVTVYPMPTTITGLTIMCVGSNSTFTSTPSGGTWSASNSNISYVSPGVFLGVSAGTSIITYSTGGSCYVTHTVTVNNPPSAITGSFSICIGTSSTLSSSTSGGIWTSSTLSVATVGPTTGIVNGVGLGTSNITYTVAGCRAIQNVTVVAAPAPIVGPSTVCLYFPTITLTNISGGGTWSSSNTNASVGATTGVVTGNVTGTSTITYALSAGCVATKVVTVLPAPAAISGTMTMCEGGGTTTLSHSVTGGTWVTAATNITVGFGTGLVTGITAGTADVTYTLPTGCVAIATVTVNPNPAAISGVMAVCVTQTTTLSCATPGVTWSSLAPGIATVGGSTGVVTGIAAGTATIVASTAGGCQTTAVVTVNTNPSSITGTPSVCVGQTTALASATPGGAWSSSNTAVGTVSGTGSVYGVSGGTTTITYALAGGCYTTTTVTVNPGPAPITGTPIACVGYACTLNCITSGGTWSTGCGGITTLLSPGLYGGSGAGTCVISYTIGATGCSSSVVVTINPAPSIIGGTLSVCQGQTTTLSNTVSGGTWSSTNPAVGTIDPITGVLTGITPGTTTISYSLGSGCDVSAVATVNPLPAAITGPTNVCAGGTVSYSSTPGGGTWSAACPGVATISSGGSLTASGAGTCTVVYSLATGCSRSLGITVNSLPSVITGITNVCVGATTTLTSTPAGGTWTASNGNVSVDPVTGVVTGVFAGTSTVSYTTTSGCYRTTTILINGLPTGIAPSSIQVCEGSTLVLTGSPAGGTWQSSTTAVGTISTGGGTLGGITAGTTNITYTLATGCSISAIATVNSLPGSVTGVLTTCIGQSTTLNCTPAGGTWTMTSGSGSGSIGSSSGILLGSGAGTVTVSYTISTGCRRTAVATVYALPGTITGGVNVCASSTSTLNCTPTGGTWSMACAYATVGLTTGIVNGLSTGTCDVTYTLGTGCTRTGTVNVLPLPAPISGPLTTCVGQTTTLSSSPAGTWSISPTSVATVISGSGLVTGISGGSGSATATVTYTIPTGCRVTDVVSVYALPSPITGTLQVCAGSTTTLSTSSPGGTWVTSNAAVGTIDASSGILTGLGAGTTICTYSLGTGCYVTAVATVHPLPASISGSQQVCQFGTTTLTSSSPGGTWTSSAPGIASVSGGVVNGVTPGTATISYSLGTGCAATVVVTVNSLPGTITGPSPMWVCENSTITLSCTPTGGVWSSGSANVAVNPVTGDVTGVSAGTANVTYTVGTGCIRTTTVTVNAQPAAFTGNPAVCFGATTTLATTSTGGTWTSSIPAVATIDPTGLVTSISVGTTVVSYTLPVTTCSRSVVVTVNSLPTPIVGPAGFCNLSSATYMSSSVNGVRWSTADTSILVVDSTTGVATGVSVDTTDLIVYDPLTRCAVSKRVFLILAPYPITGPHDMCLGQTRTLNNVISGGTWMSSAPGICSVNSSTGDVTGVTLGTATITYVLSTGCASTYDVTVNPIPTGIVGPSQICEADSRLYTNATPGGTWMSSNPPLADIDTSSGVLTAVGPTGTVIITYALGTGCNSTKIVTVNPLPSLIGGPNQVCEGSNITPTVAPPGGVWGASCGNLSIDPSTGVITGYFAGTCTIVYTLPTGCFRNLTVTVNPLPSPIVGVTDICVGEQTTMTNATAGGMWVSSNPAVGSIDAGGVFTAITGGAVTISYVLPTACIATHNITVHDNPSPISGSTTVCAGFSTNLSSSPSTGVWSQSPTSLIYGSINPLTGVVSGIMAGFIPVTYTLGTGCRAVDTVEVITLPAVIGGIPNVCVNDSTILSCPVAGGTWSSSNTARATVNPLTGAVTGISPGTAVITYQVSTGCFNVHTVTVNPLPAPITGTFQVCEQSTTVLSSATAGGAWMSSATAVGSVFGPIGPTFASTTFTGVSAGTTTVTYMLFTGCKATVEVTVNATPAPITGNPHICMGASNVFSSTSTGGIWSSSNPAIATIGATSGIATSVSLGVVTISYTYPGTGCTSTRVVTVQPLPAVFNVTGGGNFCAGGSGVHVNLSGSQPGVSYQLYYGSSATGFLAGTGFALDFGLHTAAGTYTVQATNVTSGCQRNMSGAATIVVNPLVTPIVNIATTPTDSVCEGETVAMTAMPTFGGTAPAYTWKVNGVFVSTADNYSYIPANGDVVTVTMTSNYTCVATTAATGTQLLTVMPLATPVAGVITTPGDTVCQYNPVTFSAAPVYGGSTPTYTWLVNGTTAAFGPSFTYVPTDGDIVNLQMTSNYRCRAVNTVLSGDVTMNVDSMRLPTVTVTPEPGSIVAAGKPVTMHAWPSDAGPNPSFQWKVNGILVPGATSDTYTAVFHDYDSISVTVISSGVCHNIGTSDWFRIDMAPLGTHQTSAGASQLRLVPNPNKGTFTISGNLASGVNEDVHIEITDMLGQVVFRGNLVAKNGRVDNRITLENNLANGMYMLTLRTDTEQKVFHFVLEQ